jgi:hypothetical protein
MCRNESDQSDLFLGRVEYDRGMARAAAVTAGIAAVLVAAAGCGEHRYLDVAVQPATLATASTSWMPADAILVSQPGGFTFPQPLAIQIRLHEDAGPDAEPRGLELAEATLAGHAPAPHVIEIAPACAGSACTAELRLDGAGHHVFRVRATAASGDVYEDCFYYALIEAGDPASVDATAELEALRRACRAGK